MRRQNKAGRLSAGLLAGGLALQLLALPALAQGEAPHLEQARKLLAAGHAGEAVDLLDQDLLQMAGSPDYDDLLGQALYQSGHADQALFAYERVVIAEPGNVDVRLKMAQINAERGNVTLGREILAPLAGQSLSPPQQQVLDQVKNVLATLGSGRRVSVQGYVLAGFGWDTNVTSGPDQRSLIIPALGDTPTDLGSAARKHDLVGMAEAGLILRKPVGENTWLIGNGSARQNVYRSNKASQEGIANLDLGVVTGMGSNLFGVSALAQDYLLGDQLYRQALGGRLNWTHAFENKMQASGYFQYVDFDYPEHAIDSSVRRVVGVSSEYAPSDQSWVLQYGAYGGVDYAKDPTKPHFSYRLWGLNAGANVPLNERLALTFGAIYEPHEYLAEDALYRTWRRDSMRSIGISANYRLDDNWHVIPLYTYTRNVSTLALYDYSRSTFMLQLKWEFSK